MRKRLLVLFVTILLGMGVAQGEFVRLAKLPRGAASTVTPCFSADMDHDGYIEFGMWCQDEVPVFQGWEIWKCIPPDTFAKVKEVPDSWGDPTKPGIVPWDVGDVDGDGRTELVGITSSGEPDYIHYLATVESEDYYDYPSYINWKGVYERGGAYFSTPFRLANLDEDGKTDILFVNGGMHVALVFENVRNDSNCMVWTDTMKPDEPNYLSTFVCGDFDGDGLVEFLSSNALSEYVIWEHTGTDNSYHRIHTGMVSSEAYDAYDVFGGEDMDLDGKPEFFINVISTTPKLWCYHGIGNNQYDSVLVGVGDWTHLGVMWSDVGDVDGDSLLEVVWSLSPSIWLLDDAQHGYVKLDEWRSDHYGNSDQCLVTCTDLDLDGKDEILVTGCFRTSILKWKGTSIEEKPAEAPPLIVEIASVVQRAASVKLSVCKPARVSVRVYDAAGRFVTSLTDGHLDAGEHHLTWDASLEPAGVYFIRATTPDNQVTCKVTLLQ